LSYLTEKERLVQFIGCANLRVALDFDVLANNLRHNTSRVDAHVDANLMQELMQSQKREWDVGYGSMRSPLDDKLDVMDELVCFPTGLRKSCSGLAGPECRWSWFIRKKRTQIQLLCLKF
jgi:hypothetical protein